MIKLFESYSQKGRVVSIDLIKLVAALMVIFSHTLLKYVSSGDSNPLFNLIWLSQMPLFMFASGFTNIKASNVPTIKKYFLKILKNSLVLLVPCITFLFITCAIDRISIATGFVRFYQNPESNLWFLWVLFVIHVFFDFGLYLSNKFKSKIKTFLPVLIALIISIIIIALMLLLKNKFDFSTLSLKLVAYYIIFYCIGYIFHLLVNSGIFNNNKVKIFSFIVLALLLIVLAFECFYFKSIYSFDDSNLKYVAIRIIGSISAIALFAFIIDLLVRFSFFTKLSRLGAFSLQSYYLHLIFLRFLTFSSESALYQWLIAFGASFILIAMVFCSLLVIYFIPYLHLILFGKSFSRYKFERNLNF